MTDLHPSDYFHDEFAQECWACGGSGEDATMCECQTIEDTCLCIKPTPVDCQHCKGEGYFS